MTNKPMLSVERELLEDMLNPCADFATHERLRALLNKPARQVPECVGDLERFEADDGVFVRLGDVIDMLGNEKAAQHQAGSMSFEQARDGIADFLADNMPIKKYTLAEIERMIREVAPTPTN